MKSKRKKNVPHIMGGQLPKLSSSVPMKVVMVTSAINDNSYVRTLLDIGVIDPARIGAGAGTPRDILKQGLAAWFYDRKRDLEEMHFGLGIVSVDTANTFYQSGDGYGDSRKATRPCLAIRQAGEENMRTMKDQAEALEESAPGLFRLVLKLIERSSDRTIYIRFPEELWDEYCSSWYGTDSSETWTAKHIKELKVQMRERLGEDEPLDKHMPDVTRPLFGFDHWGYDPRKKSKKHKPKDEATIEEFEAISKTSADPFVQDVSAAAAALQRLLQEATDADAELPQFGRYDSRSPIYSGCCLQYADHADVWDALDEIGQYKMQGGDNCEYHGLVEIPESPEDLAVFFQKLDLSFRLLRQMDKVISLISSERRYGYEDDGEGEEGEEAEDTQGELELA